MFIANKCFGLKSIRSSSDSLVERRSSAISKSFVRGKQAARQLRKQGVKRMNVIRDFMFRRFGAGQPELIQERVRTYLLGMPDANGEAFPRDAIWKQSSTP